MTNLNLEQKNCSNYIRKAKNEMLLIEWLRSWNNGSRTCLLMAEGFEERMLGVLTILVNSDIRLAEIIIGRYTNKINDVYRERLETMCAAVAPGHWNIIPNSNDGKWLEQALKQTMSEQIILDITAISNRAFMPALDIISSDERQAWIAYSEALCYWPKKDDWINLKSELNDKDKLAQIVDDKPWLFGFEHTLSIVDKHEGYDTGGFGRALVGFLPFKCARLAAVLAEEDYSDFLFIAGRPRLHENNWRLQALKEINYPLTRGKPVKIISTFSYKNTIHNLSKFLLGEDGLCSKYDIHLAIQGSKLQTVGCWVLSCLIPSITIITSSPKEYYPKSFSEGIGSSWIFPLIAPTLYV